MAPELTVSVDVAVAPGVRNRLVGFTPAAHPLPAETDRENVAPKPPRLAVVVGDVSEEPATILTVEELEARLKSVCCATVRLTETECERLPLVPVTTIT